MLFRSVGHSFESNYILPEGQNITQESYCALGLTEDAGEGALQMLFCSFARAGPRQRAAGRNEAEDCIIWSGRGYLPDKDKGATLGECERMSVTGKLRVESTL